MKLTNLLDIQGIPYERHLHATTWTSQRLADVEHVSGNMVAKPVVVKGASSYAVCVIPADSHLDLVRAAEILDEPQVRLATENEMEGLFPECELGAEPPVGKLAGLKTIMDMRLRENKYLVMQAGTHSEAIRMLEKDWERVCKPTAARIAIP